GLGIANAALSQLSYIPRPDPSQGRDAEGLPSTARPRNFCPERRNSCRSISNRKSAASLLSSCARAFVLVLATVMT
ncbi:uncharacterized protein METZ01_LOCUS459656, partial [marine metagenome]